MIIPNIWKINMFQTTNQYGFHLRYWWSSLIIIDPYPHASTWIVWIHIGLIKRCTFRNHTNTCIGPGSILEYRTHYKPSFKCPFFPAFTTHAEVQYPLRQAMELVNWFVNAWFQPITCVAVKGSNPITNSSKQVVFISSRSLWTSNKPLQHKQFLPRPHCISIWIHYKYRLLRDDFPLWTIITVTSQWGQYNLSRLYPLYSIRYASYYYIVPLTSINIH